MKLYYENGTKKEVKNLTTPIRIQLDAPPFTDETGPQTYKAYNEMVTTVHMIPCTNNDSSVLLKAKPNNDSFVGDFFLFVQKGYPPSLIDHQYNCTLPNEEPIGYENMTEEEQNHFENEVKWRCIFHSERDLNYTCIGR